MRAAIVAVTLAMLTLASCSGGEGPDAVEPPTRTVLPTVPAIDDAVATDAASPERTATPTASAATAPTKEPPHVATPLPPVRETGLSEMNGRDAYDPTPTPRPTYEMVPLWVVDVEHCLNVRAEPYIEAEIVECIPPGESVHSYSPYPRDGPYSPYAIEGRDGVTWRGLGWPFWGFASDRYLGGPEPEYVVALPPYVAAEEFPNVTVLGQPIRRQWLPAPTDPLFADLGQLDRIYRRSDGDVVRETVMTLDDLAVAYPDVFVEIGGPGMFQFSGVAVTPDGSHIHVGVCTGITYFGNSCIGTFGLFRSTDGGVTWSYLGSVNQADVPNSLDMGIVGVLPGEEPQLVVLKEGRWQSELRLFPGGETRVIDHHRMGLSIHDSYKSPIPPGEIFRAAGPGQLLRDGRIAMEVYRHPSPGDDYEYFWLAEDGEDLGNEVPDHLKWVLPETSPIPSDLLRHYLPGDDPPEGWSDDISWLRHYHLESIRPRVVVQHGPFLQVVDVGEDCLPLRASPAPDAEELDCVAERVLLQDQHGDVITDEDITWRKVRTPAGVGGWADGRYLE